ncbi:MAG: heavy-metal-associated domain-containing protein [Dysgonomonas sp.]
MRIENQRTLKFKTNINCSGCVAKITPVLDTTEGVVEWVVDTENPNKILTIISGGITEQEVIKLIKENGFTIELL